MSLLLLRRCRCRCCCFWSTSSSFSRSRVWYTFARARVRLRNKYICASAHTRLRFAVSCLALARDARVLRAMHQQATDAALPIAPYRLTAANELAVCWHKQQQQQQQQVRKKQMYARRARRLSSRQSPNLFVAVGAHPRLAHLVSAAPTDRAAGQKAQWARVTVAGARASYLSSNKQEDLVCCGAAATHNTTQCARALIRQNSRQVRNNLFGFCLFIARARSMSV